MNTQRILIGSIKVNTNEFVVIKNVIVKCHCSVEEIYYLVSYHFTYAYESKATKTQIIFHYSIRPIANDKCT